MVISRVKLIDQLVGHNGSDCSPSLPNSLSEEASCSCPEHAGAFSRGLVNERGGSLHRDINAGEPHRAGQEDLSAAQVQEIQAPPDPCRTSVCARRELKGTWSPVRLSAPTMIPSKILVYHHPPNGTSTEDCKPTRRRKKSLGDLFHNGYRVRCGPAAPEKEERQSFWQSLVSCSRVCASWGKVPPSPSSYPPKLSCVFGGCPGRKCPSYTLD